MDNHAHTSIKIVFKIVVEFGIETMHAWKVSEQRRNSKAKAMRV